MAGRFTRKVNLMSSKTWETVEDYKCHLYQEVAECETVEEMEVNRPRGVSEPNGLIYAGFGSWWKGRKCRTNTENREK